MDAKEQKPESYTYAKAGVSIETGNALVRAIAPLTIEQDQLLDIVGSVQQQVQLLAEGRH